MITRIPYPQAFANGNKRTSRVAANAPLLSHGMLPFSFSDVNKADYIRGMAAVYELSSMHVIEQTFIEGYAKSVVRSSNMPANMRTLGLDVDTAAKALVDFVNTGRQPLDLSQTQGCANSSTSNALATAGRASTRCRYGPRWALSLAGFESKLRVQRHSMRAYMSTAE